MRGILTFFALFLAVGELRADSVSYYPIVFVTQVPNPDDFGTLAATFGNHIPNPDTAFRGGDLWIRYANGTLRNLTEAAGYGNTGFQGANSIAVRDPSVHWDGKKIIFSMVVGNPTQQYQVTNHKWQIYKIENLGASETPVITKLPNQPTGFNNHSPIYATDDSIIFVSDRPRDNTVMHIYPQRDEYESSPVNTGLWRLFPESGELVLLDHAPSGDFNPIIDTFGRVIFTRWDHLQRDQQNVGASMQAHNFESEESTTSTGSAPEVFPEPRSVNDPDYKTNMNLHTLNQFFPWMMNQDGTDLETLNHVGRQEIGVYSERNFNDDPNVQEFYGQYTTGKNQNDFTIMLHIKENEESPGTYLGTNCQEFGTHSAGQIISLTGAPSVNPNDMMVSYLTHPDTSGATDTPDADHTGLYRDPLPIKNGKIVAAHTTNTRQDENIGTGQNPLSRYAFRLKVLTPQGGYLGPGTNLTNGITKSVSFWDPDKTVSYNGELWEMMPVELKSRTRPTPATPHIPDVESALLSSLEVNVSELQDYLRQQNLALIISRNLTMRDKNDRQQPTNLRVAGSATESLPNSGKVYDISLLQIFQGDLIRGYKSGNNNGRRVLAQPMHSVGQGINPAINASVSGAVELAEDGSMAAFVPARRALSWQLTNGAGEGIVRERYWVTFQPGEIRVCATCHGLNSSDHLGRPKPTNPPLALSRLIAHWKNLPRPEPTPTPVGTDPGNNYKLAVKGSPALIGGGKFSVKATGGSPDDDLQLKVKLGKISCRGAKLFKAGRRTLKGVFPKLDATGVTFTLLGNEGSSLLASKKVKIKRSSSEKASKASCRVLLKSLR